jgi:RNA polymerase sigma-70 factor (ECF subfamily)
MDGYVLTNLYPIKLSMIDSHLEYDRQGDLDAQAITTIYNHYFPEIFHYVQYRLCDDALAEDISSEVFFCWLKAVKSGDGPAKNLRGWLIGTARHLVVDHIRRKYRHPSQVISEAIKSDEAGLCELVEYQDRSHVLHMALSHLTEEQQQVLALRFGQGYSLDETAAIMKKKINAIKALQFRALNALHRRIGKENE